MLKVIIVEDEVMIRNGLACTLPWQAMNCIVVDIAKDGEEGLQKIMEHKPDIILSDIQMPKCNGLEMVERAQKQGYVFHTIFLTSYSDFNYAKKAIDLQCAQYLLKPLNEAELAAVVQKIQEQQSLTPTNNSTLLPLEQDYEHFMQYSGNLYVQKCLQYIQLHYIGKCNIAHIADTLKISSSYLSRKLKEELHYGFLDIVSIVRLYHALQLLKQQSYKIYEIAEQCGFNDYKHFCIVFKKYMQCSPSKFKI